MKPLLFGKYCLLERVSVGGMAEVFRAKPFDAPDFRGYLALKRILPHLAEDDEFIKMFVDEAKLTVQLNHPNIVRIYELGQFQRSYYILMEFISGKDVLALQKTMRRVRNVIPVNMSMFVAREVARGLHYAHHKRDPDGNPLNIIHRDISPQNVLIDYRGRVKIIDFGIAKATVQSTRTAIGVLKGKMGYMSPEQVRGEVLDYRSDVFAAGAVLWEMLTNRRLFHGENEFETMQKVRDAIVDPPSTRNELIPPQVDAIVMRALTRDPEDRYENAAALADAIDGWLAQNPYTADDLSVWMRTVYADDLDEERAKRDEFAAIVTPEDVIRVQEAELLPEIEAESLEPMPAHDLGAEDSEVAADWARPEQEVPPPEIRDSGGWAASEAPAAGQAAAEFADKHTTLAAGGFDASEAADDSAEFETLRGNTPVLDGLPAVTAAMQPSEDLAKTQQLPAAVDHVQVVQPLVDEDAPTQPQEPIKLPDGMRRPPPPTEPPTDKPPLQTSTHFESEDTSAGKNAPAGPPKGFWVIAAICALLALGGLGAAAAVLLVGGAEGAPEVGAGTGSIEITTTPAEGVEIVLDGAVVATRSPHNVADVAQGAHVVEARAAGFEPASQNVDVAAGAVATVALTLTPADDRGFLTLRMPDGAMGLALYLDGERQVVEPGKNPTLDIEPGKHFVEVVADGARPWSFVADIESQARREEVVELQPAGLTFEILAPKSSIRFGEARGRGTLLVENVNPREIHKLSVSYRGQGVSSWSGYLGLNHILEGSIEVDFDKPTPRELRTAQFGFVQISTGDDWWEVLVNDKPTGLVTPIGATGKLPLLAGEHKLTFKRGDASHDKQITIMPQETLIVRESLKFEWAGR